MGTDGQCVGDPVRGGFRSSPGEPETSAARACRMGGMLFTRKRQPVRPAAASVPTPPPPSRARAAWSDALGLFAIRSVQIIAIVILGAGLVWAMRSVTVVVIPVLLALILAAAVEPVMAWLR